jgi:hypothetical protein
MKKQFSISTVFIFLFFAMFFSCSDSSNNSSSSNSNLSKDWALTITVKSQEELKVTAGLSIIVTSPNYCKFDITTYKVGSENKTENITVNGTFNEGYYMTKDQSFTLSDGKKVSYKLIYFTVFDDSTLSGSGSITVTPSGSTSGVTSNIIFEGKKN